MGGPEKPIVVAGATGTQGGAVARSLLSRGHWVRAMTRRPDSTASDALRSVGAEIVAADFGDLRSLRRVVDGAWGVFSVQNAHEGGAIKEEEDGKRFAEVARDADVACFVYTGVGGMTGESGVAHYDSKHRIATHIRKLQFPAFTILGPTFFMENFASGVTKLMFPELTEGRIVMTVPASTRLQLIAVADIARAAVTAFERPGVFSGKTIDLAGDDLSLAEIAATLSRSWGRPIVYEQAPQTSLKEVSWQTTQRWYEEVGWKVGIATLEDLLGFRLIRLADWAEGC